jgi:hypothetical protein
VINSITSPTRSNLAIRGFTTIRCRFGSLGLGPIASTVPTNRFCAALGHDSSSRKRTLSPTRGVTGAIVAGSNSYFTSPTNVPSPTGFNAANSARVA